MLSSSEEDILLLWLLLQNRRQHRRRANRRRSHPYRNGNINSHISVAARELQQSDEKFKECYRMTKETYLELQEIMSPYLQNEDSLRDSVSPNEKLLMAIMYLGGTLKTFAELGLHFDRAESTVGSTVPITIEKIWRVLRHTYMQIPNVDRWIQIAERYNEMCDLPNCIGFIYKKQFKINKSTQYVKLIASVDVDGMFTLIEVKLVDGNSDVCSFNATTIGRSIEKGILNIPPAEKLPHRDDGVDFPFYFVGDKKYRLKPYLMRPFLNSAMTDTTKIFNEKLSQTKKTVDNAFSNFLEKFGILNLPINCPTPKMVTNVVLSACVLHNFVKSKEGVPYLQRSLDKDDIHKSQDVLAHSVTIGPKSSAISLRKYLNNYFLNH